MAPISDLHAMLEKIGRERHAKRLNRIANHPDVAPWVRGALPGELDFASVIRDPRNILLMSQHGGMIFTHMTPGIYEVHTLVLPEGRGDWTLNMVRACLHWMFTRTDMMELVTRCPKGNLAASSLARAAGCSKAYVTPPTWPLRDNLVPCTVYSMTIQQWIPTAPGLVERGKWVEKRLGWAGFRMTETPDPEAHRYMGLMFEMFLNGQVQKSVLFSERWAKVAGHGPAEVASERPAAIAFPGATVVFQENTGDFYLAGVDRTQSALR